LKKSDKRCNKNNEACSKRNWVNKTKALLQTEYGQEIVNVEEDTDIFKTTEYPTGNNLLDPADKNQNTPI